jgi:hypothetical protein
LKTTGFTGARPILTQRFKFRKLVICVSLDYPKKDMKIMSDQNNKIVTREELYKELWQTPMGKIAAAWGVGIASIVKGAEAMNVPRPTSEHWQLIGKGWKIDQPTLPDADEKTPTEFRLKRTQKRPKKAQKRESAPSTAEPPKLDIKIPATLDNAHPLVKRTRNALTHDTYLHHGMHRDTRWFSAAPTRTPLWSRKVRSMPIR